MDKLKVATLRELAASRHIDLPPALTKLQLQQAIVSTGGGGPFGVDLNAPLYQQVLQLRILPLFILRDTLRNAGKLPDQLFGTLTYEEAIEIMLGRQLDTVAQRALDYYSQPVESLRSLSGSAAHDKFTLISQIVDPGSFTPAQFNQGHISPSQLFRQAGFGQMIIRPRALKPLTGVTSPLQLSPKQLAAAVVEGYDISAILTPSSSLPIGDLGVLQQTLSLLGSTATFMGSLLDQYRDVSKQLVAYSRYPPGPWWWSVQPFLRKIYPAQLKSAALDLGLITPGEVVSDAEVVFRLSRGAPSPGERPEELAAQPADVITVLTQRYGKPPLEQVQVSPMESLLLALLRIPPTQLRTAASRYGIKLPREGTRDVLLQTIFLYEWVNPAAPPLVNVLAGLKPENINIQILRQYNDFQLWDIWPGFTDAPVGRRALLAQAQDQLRRRHYFLCPGSPDAERPAQGTYDNAVCWTWEGMAAAVESYTESQRGDLIQLSRVLAKMDAPEAPEQEAVVVEYLTQAFRSIQPEGSPTEPAATDKPVSREVLIALFQLGQLAFGWNGQSRYPIERDEPNVGFIPYAQASILGDSGTLTTEPYYRFSINGLPESIGVLRDLMAFVRTAQPYDVAAHSIPLIQTAYYYLAQWYDYRVIPCNPFVYGV